jgi:hypothetical protein
MVVSRCDLRLRSRTEESTDAGHDKTCCGEAEPAPWSPRPTSAAKRRRRSQPLATDDGPEFALRCSADVCASPVASCAAACARSSRPDVRQSSGQPSESFRSLHVEARSSPGTMLQDDLTVLPLLASLHRHALWQGDRTCVLHPGTET